MASPTDWRDDALCVRPECPRKASHGGAGYCKLHYERRLAMGLTGLVDSAPAIKRLEELRRAGWTFVQIGAASGLHPTVPGVLLRNRYGRVRKCTADAIVAVRVVKQASRLSVDSTGSRRRMQALAWMGWNIDEVARRAGVSRSLLNTVYRPQVSHTVARTVEQIYERLSHVKGPSTVAAAKARGFKHPPPAAWDDDTIDDPNAVPDLGARKARGVEDLAEEARFLLGFGLPLAVVAKRLVVSESWLRQLLGGGKRAAA